MRAWVLVAGLLCKFIAHADVITDVEPALLRPVEIASQPTDKRFSWGRGEYDADKIDILVAYDRAAVGWVEANEHTIQSFAEAAVLQMNEILAQTDLDKSFTFRLAGICDLGVDLSSWELTFMPSFACGKLSHRDLEGVFEPLRAYRNSVAADLVAILINTSQGSLDGAGIGLSSDYLSKAGMERYAEYAYCACTVKSALSRYTLMHEVGHLMGAGHADLQKSTPGPLLRPYSSGCYFEVGGETYTTVMGYPGEKTGLGKASVRLPFFSSPEYLFEGAPVGTASKNDNTRTLRETFAWVANFRVANPIPGWKDEPEPVKPVEPVVEGLSVSVLRGNGDPVSDGQEVVLNRFVTESFAIKATAPSSKAVTVRVSGLPTGMKFTAKTGTVSGFPKKAGRYNVKVVSTCKGEDKKTVSFTMLVNEAPSWLAGDYWGLVDLDGERSLGTLKVSTAGKISLKCNCGGRSRTFTCSGFSRGGGLAGYAAAPAVKIGSTSRTLTLDLENRRAIFSGGVLLQKPWGRKDVAAPKIKKQFKATYGDLLVRISTTGKALISGKANGVRVSGTSQVVMASGGDGAKQLRLPIALNAKKGFEGLFEWAAVEIAADGTLIKKVE